MWIASLWIFLPHYKLIVRGLHVLRWRRHWREGSECNGACNRNAVQEVVTLQWKLSAPVLFVCCLYVYFHVLSWSHVIGVMSEETCLVLACWLGHIMDVMPHVTSCYIEGHVTCHVMVFFVTRHVTLCLSLPLQCTSLLRSHHSSVYSVVWPVSFQLLLSKHNI